VPFGIVLRRGRLRAPAGDRLPAWSRRRTGTPTHRGCRSSGPTRPARGTWLSLRVTESSVARQPLLGHATDPRLVNEAVAAVWGLVTIPLVFLHYADGGRGPHDRLGRGVGDLTLQSKQPPFNAGRRRPSMGARSELSTPFSPCHSSRRRRQHRTVFCSGRTQDLDHSSLRFHGHAHAGVRASSARQRASSRGCSSRSRASWAAMRLRSVVLPEQSVADQRADVCPSVGRAGEPALRGYRAGDAAAAADRGRASRAMNTPGPARTRRRHTDRRGVSAAAGTGPPGRPPNGAALFGGGRRYGSPLTYVRRNAMWSRTCP